MVINENEREPGREYFTDLIDEMIQANWGPSVDGYWTNKIKNGSLRELRKEKLNLDVDGNGKVYVDTTRNEVNDYLEVIADVVLNAKDTYDSIPKVNKTKKSWRAADERKVGLRETKTLNEREGNNMKELKKLVNERGAFTTCVVAMLIDKFGDVVTLGAGVEIGRMFRDEDYELEQVENEIYNYQDGLNDFIDMLLVKFGYRDLTENKTLTENLQDYYEGEILGKSIILRDLLNIEFPLNALTNDLGEYLGYDEEDFTKEELDSRVIVTDIYTDADGYIGAEIKFENRDLTENRTLTEGAINFTYSDYDLATYVFNISDKYEIDDDLGDYPDEDYDDLNMFFGDVERMIKMANRELEDQQSLLASELNDKEVTQILEELGHGLYNDDDYNREALGDAELLELAVWPGYYEGFSMGFNYVDPDIIRVQTEGSPAAKNFANTLIGKAEDLLAEIADETYMRKARSGGWAGPIFESKTLNEDVSVINTVIWNGNTLEDWARNDGWHLDHLIDLLESEGWVWQDLFDIIDGRTLTATELNDFLRFDAEDIVLDLIGREFSQYYV